MEVVVVVIKQMHTQAGSNLWKLLCSSIGARS